MKKNILFWIVGIINFITIASLFKFIKIKTFSPLSASLLSVLINIGFIHGAFIEGEYNKLRSKKYFSDDSKNIFIPVFFMNVFLNFLIIPILDSDFAREYAFMGFLCSLIPSLFSIPYLAFFNKELYSIKKIIIYPVICIVLAFIANYFKEYSYLFFKTLF